MRARHGFERLTLTVRNTDVSATKCYRKSRKRLSTRDVTSGELPRPVAKSDALRAPHTYEDGDGNEISITPERVSQFRKNLHSMAKKGLLVPVPYEHRDDAKPLPGNSPEWKKFHGYLDDVKLSKEGTVQFVVQPRRGADVSKWPGGTSIEMSAEWGRGGDRWRNPITHLALTHFPVASEQPHTWDRMSKNPHSSAGVVRMSLGSNDSSWETIAMPARKNPFLEGIEDVEQDLIRRMSSVDFKPTNDQVPGGKDHQKDKEFQMSDDDEDDDSYYDEAGDEDGYVDDTEGYDDYDEEGEYEMDEAPPEPPLPDPEPAPAANPSADVSSQVAICKCLEKKLGISCVPDSDPGTFVQNLALILQAIENYDDDGGEEEVLPDEDPEQEQLGEDEYSQVEERFTAQMSTPNGRKRTRRNRLSKNPLAVGIVNDRKKAAMDRVTNLVEAGKIPPAEGKRLVSRIPTALD